MVLGALPSLLAMAAALWLVSPLGNKSLKGELFKEVLERLLRGGLLPVINALYTPYELGLLTGPPALPIYFRPFTRVIDVIGYNSTYN